MEGFAAHLVGDMYSDVITGAMPRNP